MLLLQSIKHTYAEPHCLSRTWVHIHCLDPPRYGLHCWLALSDLKSLKFSCQDLRWSVGKCPWASGMMVVHCRHRPISHFHCRFSAGTGLFLPRRSLTEIFWFLPLITWLNPTQSQLPSPGLSSSWKCPWLLWFPWVLPVPIAMTLILICHSFIYSLVHSPKNSYLGTPLNWVLR